MGSNRVRVGSRSFCHISGQTAFGVVTFGNDFFYLVMSSPRVFLRGGGIVFCICNTMFVGGCVFGLGAFFFCKVGGRKCIFVLVLGLLFSFQPPFGRDL